MAVLTLVRRRTKEKEANKQKASQNNFSALRSIHPQIFFVYPIQ
jgi:hypothetical protein